MGESKRRKAILGEDYGEPILLVPPGDLLPDFGTYYWEAMGKSVEKASLTFSILHPEVFVGDTEAYISWVFDGRLGTLIVPAEFGRYYAKHPGTPIEAIVDPSDVYTSGLGERVMPFKLTKEFEQEFRSKSLVT